MIPHTCDTTEPNCGYNPCINTDPAVLSAEVTALRTQLDEAVRLLRQTDEHYPEGDCDICAFLATIDKEASDE